MSHQITNTSSSSRYTHLARDVVLQKMRLLPCSRVERLVVTVTEKLGNSFVDDLLQRFGDRLELVDFAARKIGLRVRIELPPVPPLRVVDVLFCNCDDAFWIGICGVRGCCRGCCRGGGFG